jgi:hypothetical protein
VDAALPLPEIEQPLHALCIISWNETRRDSIGNRRPDSGPWTLDSSGS